MENQQENQVAEVVPPKKRGKKAHVDHKDPKVISAMIEKEDYKDLVAKFGSPTKAINALVKAFYGR